MIHTVEENLTPDQAGFVLLDHVAAKYWASHTKSKMDLRINDLPVLFLSTWQLYMIQLTTYLLLKAARMIKNTTLVHTVDSLLPNRRLPIETDGKKSR